MPAARILPFIDETLAGETLREHEVQLHASAVIRARELLQLRFGDNAERAFEAFRRGAFLMQVAGSQIDSLDTQVQVAPGQAVRLIRLASTGDTL